MLQTGTKNVLDQKLTLQVWEKALEVLGMPPAMLRVDVLNRQMCFADFENERSPDGWIIDYLIPKEDGGTDELENLQPLNWLTEQQKYSQITITSR